MTGTLYGHVSLLWKMRSRLVWRATTRELYFYIKKPRYKIVSRFPKRRLHIFPGSRPPGIVCARELNFCVRGWEQVDPLRNHHRILTCFSPFN